MHASNCRRDFQLLTLAKQAFWAGLVLVASIWAVPAFGQEESPVSTSDGGFLFSDQFTGRRGEAYGAVFRLGVQTGPAIGREDTLIPLEFMPYGFLFDEAMVFGDLRGFRSTKDHWGANLGGGYRHYISAWDRIVGVNGYFDYDNTSGALFRQFGGGIETYGRFWDARVNAYFPTGTTEKQLSIGVVPNSQRFITNYLYFDQERILGNALRGVDMEVGVPLLGDVLSRHDVRLYAGWYHYENDNNLSTWGWKGRLQGEITPSAAVSLEVTHDKVFDTNVIFGASWSYGGYRQPDGEPKSTFDRMTTPVRRNYNVVVSRDSIIDTDIIAINPTTGNPYFFEHVASYAPGPYLGTVEDPFQNIAQAQAQAGGDIIFVHANSVYNGGPNSAVVLEGGVRVLGEGNGVRHFVTVAGLGQIELPRAEPNLPNRPTFLNSPGDAVTLANNSEFSGFVIGDANDPSSGPTGNGVFGDGIGGVVMRQNDINYAALDGIRLQNTVGSVEMRGVRVFNSVETGLNIQGGSGNILFVDDPSSGFQGVIDKTGGTGYGLLVNGTTPGLSSSVQLVDTGGSSAADVNTSGVAGILIDNAGGSVSIGNTNIVGAPQNGIEVDSGTGSVTFGGTINVSNSSTAGGGNSNAILITDKPLGSSVVFGRPVNITGRNERGFGYFNNGSNLTFRDTLTINATSAASSVLPALEFQNNSGTALFDDISIDGSSVEGILIGTPALASNNTGSFVVSGTTTVANTDVAVHIQDDDSIVQFNGLSITGYATDGVLIHDNRSSVTFQGNTLIDGTFGSLIRDPAILLHDNTGDIIFRSVSITNVVGSSNQTLPDPNGPNPTIAYASGVTVFDNPASVTFGSLSVDTVFGAGLLALNVGERSIDSDFLITGTGGLFIGGGGITSSTNAGTESAINIQESVMNVTLTSVDVFSYTSAVNLINNIGFGTPAINGGQGGTLPTSVPASFTITGAGGIAGTGGTMTQSFDSNIVARNTGDVSLNNIVSNLSGGSGVDAANTRSLTVFNGQFSGNRDAGVVAVNVPLVSITDSNFNNNGLGAGGGGGSGNGSPTPSNEIRVTASLSDSIINDIYSVTGAAIVGNNWEVSGNTITDGAGDSTDEVVFISGTNSLSSLAFFADGNTISSTTANSVDLSLSWAGPLAASVTRNILNTTGGDATGVRINSQSNTSNSDIQILSNLISGSNGDNTGIDVTTSGPSTVVVGSVAGTGVGNVINLNGIGTSFNRGMLFNFAPNTVASIYDNQITLNGDGETGMEFVTVAGPGTSLFINNNTMNITGLNGFLTEEGFVIDAVVGTINLFGTQNNVVNFNNTNIFNDYRFPVNGINGTIIVNGVPVP